MKVPIPLSLRFHKGAMRWLVSQAHREVHDLLWAVAGAEKMPDLQRGGGVV